MAKHTVLTTAIFSFYLVYLQENSSLLIKSSVKHANHVCDVHTPWSVVLTVGETTIVL